MQGAWAPPYHSSTPASAPYLWISEVMAERLRTSPSSHMRAETRWVSSDSGWMEQYSVLMAPQPPSALTERCAAWKPGLSEPAPMQWGTW